VSDPASERQMRLRGKSLGDFGRAPPRHPKREPRTTAAAVAQARLEVEQMGASGDWQRADALHLVLLYAELHRQVYGADALEVVAAKALALAAKAARNLVESYFEGDYGAAVSFMRWAWRRELEREEWRRANNREGGRLGWRLQFSPSLVSDYRVSGQRRTGPHE
jgi:hypothetical protein